MPSLLGRIEREFIFRSLENAKKPLTVFTELSNSQIPPQSYEIHPGRIEFHSHSSLIDQCTQQKDGRIPCRVRFYHQEHSLVFYSFFIITDDLTSSIPIPAQLWSENDTLSAQPVFRILREDPFFISFSCPHAYSPFLSVSERTAIGEIHIEKVDLIQLIGLQPENKGPSLRFLSVLETYKNKHGPFSESVSPEFLVFIDHEHILVFAQKSAASVLNDKMLSCQMLFSARKILCRAQMVSRVDLNRINSIYHLKINEMQEEDRRFLFESCYGTRYI